MLENETVASGSSRRSRAPRSGCWATRSSGSSSACTQAKPLKGFKGARVLELVEDHDGDTYRAVYTVRLVDPRGMGESKMSEDLGYEMGSGNVFADLGLPDAEELKAKSDLAIEIVRIIEERGLKQAEAAQILGVDQPKGSALVNGKLDGFSSRWSGYTGS